MKKRIRKKKNKQTAPRLPMDAVIALRKKGGKHTTKKGKRGYYREEERKLLNKLKNSGDIE
jgi:hypothetical protein